MNQHQKILNLLDSETWVCTSKMYAEFIADPRTRLAELKKKGYGLEWRWCKSHAHDGGSKEWRLTATPPPHLEPPVAPKSLVETKELANKAGMTLRDYMVKHNLMPDESRPAYKLLTHKYCCGDRLKGKHTHSHDCPVKQEPIKQASLF